MMSLKRWQLMVLLLIASVLVVRSHKSEEKGFEEDGGEDEHEDHFDEEGHKGEKGYHKKVFSECLSNIMQIEHSMLILSHNLWSWILTLLRLLFPMIH